MRHVPHISLFYSFINRHLGCFHVLGTDNNAAMHMKVKMSFQDRDVYPSDVYPGAKLMDHVVVLFYYFKEPPYYFFFS